MKVLSNLKSEERINILMVDDSATNLLALESILRAPDRNLVRASSGEDALRYLLDSEVAVVLRRGSRLLLVQRPPAASRWANLWEFPHGPLIPSETHEQAAFRLLLELTGMRGRLGSELLTIRHART